MASKQSFSMRVKQEALEQVPSRRHCQLAELAGILSLCNVENNSDFIKIQTENVFTVKKCFTLLKKTFNIDVAFGVRSGSGLGTGRHKLYFINVIGSETVRAVSEALKLSDKDTVDELIFMKNCCKRAFIRGCFMATGSVTDPQKSYHLEIVCQSEGRALQLCSVINDFWKDQEHMEAKSISRKKSNGKVCYVVYMKEGNQISDFLNICETYRCLMEMENIRVEKEIANSLNRRQNCEMANMVKTINAAQEQKNDILYIEEMIGLDELPEELSQLARLRLENPDMSLRELGDALTPPVGKSGVNHRLRKLKSIADELREGQ